jgi:sporulation protein YlmC with PRC-barrel domain
MMTEATHSDVALLRSRQIIGQDVVDAGGEKLGKVTDLLLDRREGEVRYLDVDLGLFQKRVLMPVRSLDWRADGQALTSRWTKAEVKALPAFDPNQPFTEALIAEMARAYPDFYGTPRPAAPVADPDRAVPRIVPMRDARDFKISKGDTDPRGWNVFGADGERVGKVDEMLVDPAALKIRYLAVDLADDLFLLKEDRHVLIPLEQVELKERGNDVWIRGASAREVARLPAYRGGSVEPVMEDAVREVFSAPGEAPPR